MFEGLAVLNFNVLEWIVDEPVALIPVALRPLFSLAAQQPTLHRISDPERDGAHQDTEQQ